MFLNARGRGCSAEGLLHNLKFYILLKNVLCLVLSRPYTALHALARPRAQFCLVFNVDGPSAYHLVVQTPRVFKLVVSRTAWTTLHSASFRRMFRIMPYAHACAPFRTLTRPRVFLTRPFTRALRGSARFCADLQALRALSRRRFSLRALAREFFQYNLSD